MTKSTNQNSPFRPGQVLLPNNPARPNAYRSPRMHARQRHSGAPWHPDYVDETLTQPGNKLPNIGKSEFHSATLIDDAIEKSIELPAIVGANGNLLIMVGFGHEVGYDATRRQNTSIATVILDQTGEIITVFPGRPSSNAIPIPLITE